MKNSVFSIILFTIFSVALTACNGGGGGGGGAANTTDTDTDPAPTATTKECPEDLTKCADTENTFEFSAELDTIANTESLDIQGNTSLTAVADSTITLPALTVSFNESTAYSRIDGVDWQVDGEDNSKGLTRARTATLSRTPTSSAVGLTFASGAITGATIYADEARSDATANIFSFTSNVDAKYMAYVTWSDSQAVNFDDTPPTQYTKMAMAIAGIETTAVPTGVGTGTAIFTGNGKGVYGNATKADNVTFGVTATAVFTSNTLTIATTGTACDAGATCNTGITASSLDIPAKSFSYSGNSITTNLSLLGMNGHLDARFYGNAQTDAADKTVVGANELGGTFALAQADTQYYYGAFGAQRGAIDFTFKNSEAINSLTSATPDATATASTGTTPDATSAIDLTTDATIVLKGLAVDYNHTRKYTREATSGAWDITNKSNLQIVEDFTLSRIAPVGGNPALELTIAGNAITGVKAYANAVHTITPATVDRSAIFGFGADSQYMAYVTWSQTETNDDLGTSLSTDTITDFDGMMIAGIETADFTPLTASNVTFTGKGAGVYDADATDATAGEATIFNVTATVNFTTPNVAIATNGTVGAIGSSLDFTNFATITDFNNLTAAVTSANTGTTSLAGTLDARFYGANAKELGGTFALTNANSYYYGAFGADRDALPLNTITYSAAVGDDIAATNPMAVDTKTHASLTAVAGAANGNSAIDITLQGVAVEYDYSSVYTRTDAGTDWLVASAENPNGLTIARTSNLVRITSPAVTLTFGDNGTSLSAVSAYDNASYSNATIDRATIFGFAGNANAEYMAYVTWQQDGALIATDATTNTQTVTGRHHMMIAGIETAAIRVTGTTSFTGKGAGVYNTGNGTTFSSENVTFDVSADVNFATDDVTIKTTNTSNTDTATLDFTTTAIDYTQADTSINYQFGVGANPTVAGMAGQLDARFYGTTTDEFGGTFALANSNTSYYGAFGAKFGTLTDTFTAGTTTEVVAVANKTVFTPTPTLTIVDMGELADSAGTSINLQGLAVDRNDATIYTRERNDIVSDWTGQTQDITREIGATRIASGSSLPAVTATFDANGDGTAVTAFADAEYNTTATAKTGAALNSTFGFTPKYMAYVTWSQTKTAFDATNTDIMQTHTAINGRMLAGIETSNSVLGGKTGSFSFKGKGTGSIVTRSGSAITTDASTFNVTAAIDFDATTVQITIDDTYYNAYDITTPAINYGSNNTLSHHFDGAGGGYSRVTSGFTGYIDARFYGADEFGGAFALNGADVFYYGVFGAKTGLSVSIEDKATTITTPTINLQGLTGFNVTGEDTTSKVGIALNALTVEATYDTTVETQNSNHHTGAVAEISYDASGNVESVSSYFDDKQHTITLDADDGTGDTESLSNFTLVNTLVPNSNNVMVLTPSLVVDQADISSNMGVTDPEFMAFSRASSRNFGFSAKYMASIAWHNDANHRGYSITGFESGSDIPTSGTAVEFTGRGNGTIYPETPSTANRDTRARYFKVKLTVDFANITDADSIDFKTFDTCFRYESNCGNEYLAIDDDLRGKLSYNSTTNAISGNIASKGGNDYYSGGGNKQAHYDEQWANTNNGDEMSGTANARFYGPDAAEMGGTFIVSNPTATYIGYFGAQK